MLQNDINLDCSRKSVLGSLDRLNNGDENNSFLASTNAIIYSSIIINKIVNAGEENRIYTIKTCNRIILTIPQF